MLDSKTLEWLEERKENLEIFGGYFCPNCPELVLEEIMYCGRGGGEHCIDNPHKYAFKDAAEFEARVAKHLMYQYEKTVHCAEITGGFCPSRDTMLMFSRLAVEEEMEAESARH